MSNLVIQERLSALRKLMKQNGMDMYLIVSDDFHASEYVDKYFKCRTYMSNFTGSAGNLLVTADWAGLWTDGRYFLQAGAQLEGTTIELMKMAEPGVPTIQKYVAENMKDGGVLGYDGRTVSAAFAASFDSALTAAGKNICHKTELDLVGEIWTDRPAFPAAPVWLLSEQYTGESRAARLARVREAIGAVGADALLIASLDDIAWLYNLRGDDVACNPVFMSYTLIFKDKSVLYMSPEAANAEVRAALAADQVEIRPYLQVYEDVKQLSADCTLMLDPSAMNVALLHAVGTPNILKQANPTKIFKSVKTPVEMECERVAHIRDGVAVTKLLYWLKQPSTHEAIKRGEITELDVDAKLLSLREAQPDFLDQSFSPIISTGAHGAIIHYSATPETNIPVEDNTFLLMDTGGQYLQGTTDITRTAVIGQVDETAKRRYTAVLQGNLNLAAAHFSYGCTGPNLDVLARQPIWDIGLDYKHGTGHGVGFLLNVHEGPQSIRLKGLDGGLGAKMEAGMLTSDEPGVYIEGEYGIRLENLMLCLEAETNAFGHFLCFETVTMVPFDREAILPEMMSERERGLLNAYHAKVYEKISQYLTEDERKWLKEQTAEI